MNATPEPVRHPWLIVARREIMAQLTSKVFWVGTLSTIGVIILAFLVSNLMAGMGGTSRAEVSSPQAAATNDGGTSARARHKPRPTPRTSRRECPRGNAPPGTTGTILPAN